MTTVVVTGSRSLTDQKAVVEAFLRGLHRIEGIDGDLALYLHGGAVGVDSIVADFLDSESLCSVEVVWPDYGRHKIGAPFARNQEMVDRADAAVAIWDGRSKGTAHTIACAARKGIPIAIEVVPT